MIEQKNEVPKEVKSSKLGGWKNILLTATTVASLALESCRTALDTPLVEEYQHTSLDVDAGFIGERNQTMNEVHYSKKHPSISYLDKTSYIAEEEITETRPIITIRVDTAYTEKPLPPNFSFKIHRIDSHTGEKKYSINSDTLDSKPVQILMVQNNFEAKDMGYQYIYNDDKCEDETCDYSIETNQYDFIQKNPLGSIRGDGKNSGLLDLQKIILLLEKQGFDFKNADHVHCTSTDNGDGTANLTVHVESNNPQNHNDGWPVSITLMGDKNGPLFTVETTKVNDDYVLGSSHSEQKHYDWNDNKDHQQSFYNYVYRNTGENANNVNASFTIKPKEPLTNILVEAEHTKILCPVKIKVPETTPGVTELGNECPMIQALKQDPNVFVTTYDESGKLVIPKSQVQIRDKNYFSLGSDMATGLYVSIYWYEYEGRFYQIFKQGVKEIFQTSESSTNKGKSLVLGNFNAGSLNENLPKTLQQTISQFACQ